MTRQPAITASWHKNKPGALPGTHAGFPQCSTVRKFSMLRVAQRFWRNARLMPTRSFYFDRPLVLIQSDDWGRAGVRDREGFEQLRSAGIELGQRPYDFYTLETADDVVALA